MARSGSLCTGGGMLDRALEELFDLTPAWHAESDNAASKVLKAHWPGVPNLGDITRIAWTTIGVVDLLSAGFPCQPFSASGKRGGSTDERHLWPTGVLPGIEALMPPVLVLENVPNLLPIEQGAVFARVLTDLDRLGYTVAWTVVGACKVGACHHRHRLFVLAVRSRDVRVPSQEPIAGRQGDVWLPVQQVLFGDVQAVKWPPSGVSRAGLVWPLPVETCGDGGVVLLPTPRVTATRTGRSAITGSASSPSLEQALELARGEVPRELRGLSEVPTSWDLLPTPRTSDTNGAGVHGSGGMDLRTAISLLPTPPATDTGTPGRRAGEGFRPPLSQVILPMFPASTPATQGYPVSEAATPLAGRFGKYEPAVRRHELAFNLPVPAPTEPGRAGNPRLAAPFPEWMMSCPRGYLTDVVGRNDALRIAGNGVFGPVVGYALSSLPTFPAAVALLSRVRLGVAA